MPPPDDLAELLGDIIDTLAAMHPTATAAELAHELAVLLAGRGGYTRIRPRPYPRTATPGGYGI